MRCVDCHEWQLWYLTAPVTCIALDELTTTPCISSQILNMSLVDAVEKTDRLNGLVAMGGWIELPKTRDVDMRRL